MTFDAFNKKPFVVAAMAAALLVLVSVADFVSGPSITFSLFYLLIVAFVAWTTRDLRWAVTWALVCSLAWLIAEWFTFGAPSAGVLLWNAISRLVILLTIGIAISRLQRGLDAQQQLARTDFLTGALNARAFAELAEAEIARAARFAHPFALAYLDLDDFKTVNDRFGHARGDSVLQRVAQTLQSSLRETDKVARVGGDEFVVLLPEATRDDAEAVAHKLQRAVAGVMEAHGWPVTFSIGVVVAESAPKGLDELIRLADAMMYEAKTAGKNRIRVASLVAEERLVT